MSTAHVEDVKLISIKTKSLQDLDNNINSNKIRCNDRNTNTSTNFCQNSFTEDNETDKINGEETDDEDHESTVRYVTIEKSPNGACGFHLTRSKWDPYPWVSAVDNFTPAAKTDLKAGDCVLEVNGCDVLGLRIKEIAKLIKSSQQQVTILVWSSNCNNKCDEESLCAAPMPRSLQRLSLIVQMILSLVECPVCMDTITPPAMQCQNGHLLCVNCRIRAEKCPVCRDRYFPRPALIAEQIQSTITSAFNLCRNEDKVRQKIFGRHNRQRQLVKTTLESLQQKHQPDQPVLKALTTDPQYRNAGATKIYTIRTAGTITMNRKCDRKVTDKFFKCVRCSSHEKRTTCNKFFTRLLNSKAYSMENLTNGHNNTATATTIPRNNISNICHTTAAISQLELLDIKQQQQQQQDNSSYKQVGEHKVLVKDSAARLQQQTSPAMNTNQFNDLPRNVPRKHHYLLTYKPNLNTIDTDLNINSRLCCKQMLNSKMKHFSQSSDKDLMRSKENITCLLKSPGIFTMDNNEIPRSTVVYETTYATIPKAIKFKPNHFKRQALNHSVVRTGKETARNFRKSHSSSMTSLDLSLAMTSSVTPYTSYSYNCSTL